MSTEQALVEKGDNVTSLQIHQAPQGIAPMVQMLVDSGQATVEKMGELMSLQERWEANEARKAFHAAKAAAAAELPMIGKNRKNDHLRTSYADLDAMIAGAAPVLGRHGLSFDFEYDQTNRDEVITHCVTTHAMGFEKRFGAIMPVMKPIQSGAGKAVTNGCQMVGIAMTYGRRYAFAAAFGIATGDSDNDGNIPQDVPPPRYEPAYTNEQYREFHNAIEAKDGYALITMTGAMEDNAKTGLFNSFEKGKIVSGKDVVRKLVADAHTEIKASHTELVNLMASDDQPAALQILAETEWRFIKPHADDELTTWVEALESGDE